MSLVEYLRMNVLGNDKATTSYHLTPVRMAIINKSTNEPWSGCGE